MTNLKLLVFTGILAIALSALCSVPGFGDGTCIETSKCSRAEGKSHKGYCSGKSSIQCCTSVKCGNDGICKKKGTSNGSMVSGLCPGDASFVCYKNIPCNGNGKCLWSGCNGNTVSGQCPGPNGFKCCVSKGGPTPDTQQEEKEEAKLPLLQKARLESGLIPGVVVIIMELLLESNKVLVHTVMIDM